MNFISTANLSALEAYNGQYRACKPEFSHPTADAVEAKIDRNAGHDGKRMDRFESGPGRRERGNRRKNPRLTRFRKEARGKRTLN